MQQPPKKLLDQVREAIRLKHYSYRTEESYVYWIRRYSLFHNKRHPKDMSSEEIEVFLTQFDFIQLGCVAQQITPARQHSFWHFYHFRCTSRCLKKSVVPQGTAYQRQRITEGG